MRVGANLLEFFDRSTEDPEPGDFPHFFDDGTGDDDNDDDVSVVGFFLFLFCDPFVWDPGSISRSHRH